MTASVDNKQDSSAAVGHNNATMEATMESVTDDPMKANCSNDFCVSDEQYVDMIRDYIWPTTFEWCLIAFYVFVFTVGVVGNAMVCFVVWNDRRLRTVTNLFIVNLSVADFLIIVVCLPPTVLGDVTETWYLGPVMCKIVLYLQVRKALRTLTFLRHGAWAHFLDDTR